MVIAQILQILGGGACNLQKTDDQIFSRFVDIACRDDTFFLQSGQNAEVSRELSVEGLEFIEVFGFPQFHGTVRKGHDRRRITLCHVLEFAPLTDIPLQCNDPLGCGAIISLPLFLQEQFRVRGDVGDLPRIQLHGDSADIDQAVLDGYIPVRGYLRTVCRDQR